MEKLLSLYAETKLNIKNSKDINRLELIKINFLGKKGLLNSKIRELKTESKDKRKKYGLILNRIKNEIHNLIYEKKIFFQKKNLNRNVKFKNIDITLPGRKISLGSIHPISKTINELKEFFLQLGFELQYGPEIEDVYYNFDVLNIPIEHPSRSKQDTFWFDTKKLLRTQTSSMQARSIENKNPPFYIIMPGKVYRNDYDVSHTPMFHQLEGLIIDKNVNLCHLKWLIEKFLEYFFGKDIKVRFRNSYFPFTVPSLEVDFKKDNKNWIEILGCGMVHPTVLKNFKIDSNIYNGCAFGIGIERIAMIKYDIKDIRIFFENDIRFLSQF